jgi:hypothetical protein
MAYAGNDARKIGAPSLGLTAGFQCLGAAVSTA